MPPIFLITSGKQGGVLIVEPDAVVKFGVLNTREAQLWCAQAASLLFPAFES